MTNKHYTPSDRTVFLIVVLNIVAVSLVVVAVVFVMVAP